MWEKLLLVGLYTLEKVSEFWGCSGVVRKERMKVRVLTDRYGIVKGNGGSFLRRTCEDIDAPLLMP
jgi:hypothetical protein